MIQEVIQPFFHVRYLRYFVANVMAMYLSIDNAIKDIKLAVNDINKDIWKLLTTERKPGFSSSIPVNECIIQMAY